MLARQAEAAAVHLMARHQHAETHSCLLRVPKAHDSPQECPLHLCFSRSLLHCSRAALALNTSTDRSTCTALPQACQDQLK